MTTERKSQLLPLLAAGSIKFPEESVKIQVNCISETDGSSTDGRSELSNVDLEVLWPDPPDKLGAKKSSLKDNVPLVGGSVVKLSLDATTKINTNKPEILGRYNVSKLLGFAKNKMPHIDPDDEESFVSLSDLMKARVNINKTLEEMPGLTTEWHDCGVPTLALSRTKVDSIPDVKTLQKAIDEKQKDGARIPELGRPIGYFKFIPPQVLGGMLSALLAKDSEDYGMGDYTGLSGSDFETLALYFEGQSDGVFSALGDDEIVEVLLELFPIFRVKSSDIAGGDSTLPTIGYYTAHKDSLYVKMPDLSGRDSNGDSQNIYELGTETEGNINFCFELVKDVTEYTAKAFDYQAPPALEAKDNRAEYPEESPSPDQRKTEITILKEGINEEFLSSYNFYLSPILPPGSSTSVKGFSTTDKGVELFTAPLLTSGCIDPSTTKGVLNYPDKVVSEIYQEFNEKIQTETKTGYNAVINDASEHKTSAQIDYLQFSSKENSVHKYYFFELGPPMTESLSSIGIDSMGDILGEFNRPEILIGHRDGKRSERYNEERFYENKVYSARSLLASVRPNIVVDEDWQIPAMWIKLKLLPGLAEDDFYTLEVPYMPDSAQMEGAQASLNLFNDGGALSFALYAVDHMGQMVRAPGENVRITPASPLIKVIAPSGFKVPTGTPGGTVNINLDTSISPQALFADNTLGGLKLHGPGLCGTNPTINFYSDKEGKDLVASLKDGQKVGPEQHDLTIKCTGDDIVTIESKAKFGDFLPAVVGTWYVGVQLETGITSVKLTPLFISQPETKKDDLTTKPDTKVEFENPFSLEVKKFGSAVHSIPIIQDAINNAEITIISKKKTFEEGAELYAYLAFLENDQNLNILKSDIGWLSSDHGGEGEHKEKAIIKANIQTQVSTGSFYIPTSLEWKYGTNDFERKTIKKVVMKLPGPSNSAANLSRFTEITAQGSKEYPAYILLCNEKLSLGGNPPVLTGSSNKNYAVIPIGHPGAVPGSENAPFISTPEVLGFVAELPPEGGEKRVVSNIPRSSLLSASHDISKKIKGVSLDKLKGGAEQILQIIASDSLSRLAVIFRGPDVAKMEKVHKVYIGTKSLKDDCVNVEYAGSNYIVANFKNITGIKAEGWTDIVVKKDDKRFNCSYDSVLYNKVSILMKPAIGDSGEPALTDADGKLLKDVLQLRSAEENFPITKLDIPEGSQKTEHVDYVGGKNLSTIIFPGGNGEFSPFPLIKELSYDYPSDPATDTNAYFQFSNPVKIRPSVDLVFGKDVDKGGGEVIVYGMSLSDAKVDDEGRPKDEIIKINKNGRTDVAMGILDMADAVKKAKEEAEAVIKNMKAKLEEVGEAAAEYADMKAKISSAEAEYQETAAATDEAVANAESSVMSKDEADKAAMDAAMAGADSEGGGSGIADDLAEAAEGVAEAADKAMGAAKDAIDGLNNALGMLQTITDALSNAAQIANAIADGVEDAVSSLGSRPDDFVKVNLNHIYIDKDSTISDAYISKRDDKEEFRLTTNYTFSQNAAIKFNVPEIVEVRKEGDDIPYLPFGDRPFAKLRITTGDTLHLKVIGANKDTKIEVAGKRVEARRGSPFSEGIFQNFIIKIPDTSAFSIFGLSDCISISASNSNNSRMKLGRQMGNDLTLDLEKAWDGRIFGGGRNKQGPSGDIAKHLEKLSFLKFTFVKLGKVAGGMKESLQSFCDFSFHLTAELSLQLRNLQVLMIPIKVIFCIIDVICALLNPWRLAFAIIRLFLCLYDLILLLPPIAVPAMYLALLIHLLDLLLCVILKILSTINAINEIVSALIVAIEDKNYPAVVALEEALNEHIFSLETDLSVLEPIITILNLFLQLLQLAFAFPCRVGSDDDDDACIDPSQLAGIILGKVAPTGKVAPNVLLPLAQAYTRLPAADVMSTGNSPPNSRDNYGDMSIPADWEVLLEGDILARPQDHRGSIVVSEGTPGLDIPNHMNNTTGELKQIEEGGFFRGDEDGDGQMDNVYYPTLRTQYVENPAVDFVASDGYYFGAAGNYFDATFAISFTKSTKEWSFFTGPDPRIVKYVFNSAGESSTIAWWTYWLIFPIFFSKKTISELQNLDSKPMFLTSNDAGNLVVDGSTTLGGHDFVSPIDGFSGFLTKDGAGYQPKPLTVTFELNEPGVNPDTFDAEFTPVTVTKTFGNIPMIAVVDDDFNVYFVERTDDGGGIKMDGNSIESINLKMINYPSAPKKKTGREKQTVFSSKSAGDYKSYKAETIGALAYEVWPAGTIQTDEDGNSLAGQNKYGIKKTGEAIMRATANAAVLKSEILESSSLLYNGDPIPNIDGKIQYVTDSREKKRRHGKALSCSWTGTTASDNTLKGKTLTVHLSRNRDDYDDNGLSEIRPWPANKESIGGANVDDEEDYDPISITIHITETPYNVATGVGTPGRIEIQWTQALDDALPYPELGEAYDFGEGSSKEQRDIGSAIDSVKVYDFPQFYIVDMRQLADDIAAACGASGPAEMLMDMDGFDEDFSDNINDMLSCMEAFMKHFDSEELDENGAPQGVIPRLRYQVENGILPGTISVEDAVDKFKVLEACVKDQIDKSCRFVVNPLNTGFKLLGDEDETPLTDYIDPEQTDPGALGSILVDELEFDDDLAGFPSITGAMEYASGIGDTLVAEVGTKALIEVFPRDSYDEPMPIALDLSEKINIEFVEDETGLAKLTPPDDSTGDLVSRDEESYVLAVTTEAPGKVVLKGSICGVVIQAVTDKGIISGKESASSSDSGSSESEESLEGCIPDASADGAGFGLGDGADGDSFAPGALMKVDRLLTILFVPSGAAGLPSGSGDGDGGPGSLYGDGDRDASARSAKPTPQTPGTKLEN